MPTEVNSWHSLKSIQFSQTNPWKEDRRNVMFTATLDIPDTKQVSMQVDIKQGEADRKMLLAQTGFLPDTVRTYNIPAGELVPGVNTVFAVFRDENPPPGTDGETEFQYDIIVEDRDIFAISRRLDFGEEYLAAGPATMSPADGLILSTVAGQTECVVVPVQAVQMDGRAKIKKVTVTGDVDRIGDISSVRQAVYQADGGEYILQKFPLSDLHTFMAIAKIQVIDNEQRRLT